METKQHSDNNVPRNYSAMLKRAMIQSVEKGRRRELRDRASKLLRPCSSDIGDCLKRQNNYSTYAYGLLLAHW